MIGMINLYKIMSQMIAQVKTGVMDNFKQHDQEKDQRIKKQFQDLPHS